MLEFRCTVLPLYLFDLANSNALVVTIDAPYCQFLTVRYRVCYKLRKNLLKLIIYLKILGSPLCNQFVLGSGPFTKWNLYCSMFSITLD